MAHYELYICLKKDTYESKVPDALKSKLQWDEIEYYESWWLIQNLSC